VKSAGIWSRGKCNDAGGYCRAKHTGMQTSLFLYTVRYNCDCQIYGEENVSPLNNDAFFAWDRVTPVDKHTAVENDFLLLCCFTLPNGEKVRELLSVDELEVYL
jgi:hypothetical protein